MKIRLVLMLSFICTSLSASLDEATKARLHEFATRAYSTRETIYNSYSLALECLRNNIPGDMVECGVANGAQVAAMAYACQQCNNSDKKIHLFDSFEGIPLAGPNDTAQPGVGAIQHQVQVNNLNELLISSNKVYKQLGHAAACSMALVQQYMKQWKIHSANLVYHKGWFQNTLPVDADKITSICVLRLDGDLYESTKVCLEYLYSKVSKGGYVIIDDYGSLTGCRKAVDEYLAQHGLTPTIIPIEGGMGPVYWQVQ